jgi:hypothetical protein
MRSIIVLYFLTFLLSDSESLLLNLAKRNQQKRANPENKQQTNVKQGMKLVNTLVDKKKQY